MSNTIAGPGRTVNGERDEHHDSTRFLQKNGLDTDANIWEIPTARLAGRVPPASQRPYFRVKHIPSASGGFSVNRPWSNLLIGSLVVLMLVGTAQASDWNLPNLNPFQTSNTKRPSQPSVWNRMTNGTKNFFARTYDVLTPWETEAQKNRAQSSRSSGGKSGSQRNPMFRSWWAAEEEPRQPQTVSDWLKQPRP